MNRDLRRYLWRIGRGMGRRNATRMMRTVALALATTGVVGGLIAVTMAVSAAHDRERHMQALLPIQAESVDSASALYSSELPTLYDEAGVLQSAFVVWIAPLRPDAAPPPGVERWPGPGEVVASPQLLKDVGAHRGDLFGKVVGTIGPAGLEVPAERRAYVGITPTPAEEAVMTPITGFGSGGIPGMWGFPTLNAHPTWVIILAIGGLLVVPALVALAVASGIDGEARRVRTVQLQAVGAHARHVAWLDLAEALPAIAAGSLVAGGITVVLGFSGLTIPSLDLVIPASQVRSWWSQAAVALLVAHVIAMGVLLLTRSAGRRWSRRRPADRSQRPQVALALICIAAGLAAIWIPAVSHSARVRTLGYHVPVIVVVLTLPALLAALLVVVGGAAIRYGLRRGTPSAVLGGRHLSSFPVRTARLMGGVTGAILLFGQVQLVASTLGQQYELAKAGQARYGNVVMSATRPVYDEKLSSFLAGLPPDVAPVWTTVDVPATGDRAAYHLFGSCEALRELSLDCRRTTELPEKPSRQLEALSASVGFSPQSAFQSEPMDSPDFASLRRVDAQLHLVSLNGADLPVEDLRRTANPLLVGGLGLTSVGDEWLSSGTKVALDQRWVVLWGLLGSLPLMAAAALVLAADTLVSAQETAPLAALFDRRRWLFGVSVWRVWVPMTAAGVCAALAYLILPASMSGTLSGLTYYTPSGAYAWTSVAMCAVLGTFLTLWSAWSITRAAQRWHPGTSSR